MFTNHQFTAELARQRHTEMILKAERHHRLFRRPMLVESTPQADPTKVVVADAPVIAMPAPRSSAQPPEARVA